MEHEPLPGPENAVFVREAPSAPTQKYQTNPIQYGKCYVRSTGRARTVNRSRASAGPEV